jgi:hypothetical protein
MNMTKKVILFSLFVFSSSLLASMDLNSIAGRIYEKLKEDDLTSLRQECLSFAYDKENSDSVFFSARESHSNKVCGGDSNVAEKLFDMKYDKKTGDIYIEDVLLPDSYQKLK